METISNDVWNLFIYRTCDEREIRPNSCSKV